MTAPTPESVELAKKRLAQAKARLDALNARIATEGRRLDTRRKIILGGLLLDAATQDQRFAGIVSELTHRISRDQDRTPFEGWTLPGAEIGRAHVCTPVTNAHLVCRLRLQTKKEKATAQARTQVHRQPNMLS